MPGVRIWAKEHYDWSTSELVTWTVQESNFCASGSCVSAVIAPERTAVAVHVIWNRTPTSMVGRLATGVIQLTGGQAGP
jgi:hypothetical protein